MNRSLAMLCILALCGCDAHVELSSKPSGGLQQTNYDLATNLVYKVSEQDLATNEFQLSVNRLKDQAFQAVCISWRAGYVYAQREAEGVDAERLSFEAVSNAYWHVFLAPITPADQRQPRQQWTPAPAWNLDVPPSGATNKAKGMP